MSKRPVDSDHFPTIKEQVFALERQLLALRRQLGVELEPLPEEPFSVLEVRVGASWYAIPIGPIEEVLPMVWPQPLPEAPAWVLGCVDVAGRVIPLIDLQRRLDGASQGRISPEHAMILINEPAECAFAVEELGEVMRMDPKDIIPPPRGIPQAPFLRGALSRSGDAVRFLLSVSRLSQEFVLGDSHHDGGQS